MTDQSPPPRQTSPAARPIDDEISLWEVLAVLIRRRGTILATTLVVTALAVVVALVRVMRL